jgi:hypothetical protein
MKISIIFLNLIQNYLWVNHFLTKSSVKSILKSSLNKRVKYLILDKKFLNNGKIQMINKEKYYYTIKSKKEFLKYNKNNNLIFENL